MNNLLCTPVILSESKGKYLQRVLTRTDPTEQKIKFLGRSGFTSSNTVKFLTVKKLKSIVKFNNCVHIYVWVGTCDLTAKGKRFIDLRKPTKKTLHVLCSNLELIKNRCISCGIKVTFLQIPYYSIQFWNRNKGHENPDIFSENDKPEDQWSCERSPEIRFIYQ